MRVLVWCIVPVVGGLVGACYMSHPPFGDVADDGDGADAAVADADTAVPDGRYSMHDAWDAIRCVDAECPDGTVLIPCGPFVQGSRVGEGVAPAEEPARVTWLSSYCIDRTEVTVAQYFACVAAGRCSGIDLACNPDVTADTPVRCVSSDQAKAYCDWVNPRMELPTAARWEKAARGGCELVAPEDCGPEDERRYPWGHDAPTCERANFAGCHGDVEPVGRHPAGASPYGVLDMAGNVAERVIYDDLFELPDRTYCQCRPWDPVAPCIEPTCGGGDTIRGGHFESPAGGLTVADRGPRLGPWGFEPPPEPREHFGFRCHQWLR